MRVEVLLDDDRVFEAGRPVEIVQGAVRTDSRIEFFQRQHGHVILRLWGIHSVSEVERLVGAELCIPEEQLPTTEEGVFYTFHLKGCHVVTAASEPLGKVADVLDNGGTYILKVDGSNGEILIPFAQPYLRKIDIGQRRIEVDLPEGLLDLNK